MPEIIKAGRSTVHSWTEEEVENLRQLLPKIANGRKTRYQKQKAQAKKPMPRKTKKKK